MLSHSASVASGPAATIVYSSVSISETSPEITSMRGCDLIFSVTAAENPSRSTASAPPAGTRFRSAQLIITESSRRISSLSSPTALKSPSARSELLHTSSAKSPLLCAAVRFSGFISNNRTSAPAFAACQAASQPASPAPIMFICIFVSVCFTFFVSLKFNFSNYSLSVSFSVFAPFFSGFFSQPHSSFTQTVLIKFLPLYGRRFTSIEPHLGHFSFVGSSHDI